MTAKTIFKAIVAAVAAVVLAASCTKSAPLDEPNLSASSDSHSITLIWNAVANASGYEVSYYTGTTAAQTIQTQETTITLQNLLSNTAYTFSLKALGTGSWLDSQEVTATFKTTEEKVGFDFTVSDCSFASMKITFNTEKDIKQAEYAVVSQFVDGVEAIKQFVDGKLTTTKVDIADTQTSVEIEAEAAGAPVRIIARGISTEGTLTSTTAKTASFAPVNIQLCNISLGSFVTRVAESYDATVPFVGILAMTQEAPGEWGMTAEEIVRMYAEYWMIDMHPVGDEFMVELNGEPNVPHYIGLAYFDVNYSVYDVKILEYTSGEIVAGAPEAKAEVTVSGITSKSADIKFTVNSDTYGYFYKLYTKADYDADIEKGKKFGYEDPELYIRELVSAGGSMDWRDQTDERTGLKASTDYIVVCYPYNINGTQGYGATVKTSFTTAAE